ncbi:MAG: PAS domain S-box protein, partial [Gammaproteobacteria bacterium]
MNMNDGERKGTSCTMGMMFVSCCQRYIKKWSFILYTLFVVVAPDMAWAFEYFENEQGNTNWQYVANWSSGILIILLSLSVGRLYVARRQLHRANHALITSNEELEQRVAERTATLDDSNRLLIQTNHLLEGEINRHKQTTKRLHASQTYLESILESMPLMLVGLNDDGVVTQWNRGAEQLTGLEADCIVGKMLW